MNTNSHLIPRAELESLLSEYATGMLDKGLRARVDESLRAYPDLQKEADSLSDALKLVNRDSHNAAIDYETRNLSVHVVNALTRPQRSPLRHLAWLAPAAATAVTLVVLNISGPSVPPQIAGNKPLATVQPTTQVTQQVPDVVVKRKAPTATPAQPLTREETILDDLVADQIVNRMASDIIDDSNESLTGITDAELDVLLAGVLSNESL